MRFLKYLAILMALLLVAAIGIVIYFYTTSVVEITAVDSTGVSAAERQEQFAAIRASVSDGSFQGVRFTQDNIGEAADYALITYTVRLRNQCLVPIDMVEIQIEPSQGDVLQVGDLTAKSLPAHTEGSTQATLLTSKDSHSIRKLKITYYVWGVAFHTSVTSGS